MGQPSHLERVIFWTKVTFSSILTYFETFQPKTSQTQMFRAIDFLQTSDKKSYFYMHATVCNLSSREQILEICLFFYKITRHFGGMFGRNQYTCTCNVEIFLSSLSRSILGAYKIWNTSDAPCSMVHF